MPTCPNSENQSEIAGIRIGRISLNELPGISSMNGSKSRSPKPAEGRDVIPPVSSIFILEGEI
jgi:hypothetical protein